MDGGDGYTIIWMILIPLNKFKMVKDGKFYIMCNPSQSKFEKNKLVKMLDIKHNRARLSALYIM